MQYFSKHKLHAVCKMSESRSVRYQKQHTEMHINSHAIVVPSLVPLGACDMRAVFSSQLQQTSIWSCERNSHFVTTELVVEQHCTEKNLGAFRFQRFCTKN